jgi:tRNA modification GTPase
MTADSPDVMRVANKCDLPALWDVASSGAIPVSAKTGEGIANLCDAIVRRLVPEAPAPGAAVPITADWVERIEAAFLACQEGEARSALEALRGSGVHPIGR